ncbi:MAG: hypothetical protein L0K67_10350 [Brevibacterium sp.]|nr:hypothetical protein [Brevibacterium sp.]
MTMMIMPLQQLYPAQDRICSTVRSPRRVLLLSKPAKPLGHLVGDIRTPVV